MEPAPRPSKRAKNTSGAKVQSWTAFEKLFVYPEGFSVHGRTIFEELEQLRRLFESIVSWSQEVRWLVLINDGTLAPTTGKTFKSGAELLSTIENS